MQRDPYELARPSFPKNVPLPLVDPRADPLTTVKFNCAWLPYVINCLMALTQEPTWNTLSDEKLKTVLFQAWQLIGLFTSQSASPCSIASFSCDFNFADTSWGNIWSIDTSQFSGNAGDYLSGAGYESTTVVPFVGPWQCAIIGVFPNIKVDSGSVTCANDASGDTNVTINVLDISGAVIHTQIAVVNGVDTITFTGVPWDNVAYIQILMEGGLPAIISDVSVASHSIADPCFVPPWSCGFNFDLNDGGWTGYSFAGMTVPTWVGGTGWHRPTGNPWPGGAAVWSAIWKGYSIGVHIDQVQVSFDISSVTDSPNDVSIYIFNADGSGPTGEVDLSGTPGGSYNITVPTPGMYSDGLIVRVQTEVAPSGAPGSVDAEINITRVQVDGNGPNPC